VNIRGESYRLKERRKAGLIPLPEQPQAEPPTAAPSLTRRRANCSAELPILFTSMQLRSASPDLSLHPERLRLKFG
jgi:hypothetical protein